MRWLVALVCVTVAGCAGVAAVSAGPAAAAVGPAFDAATPAVFIAQGNPTQLDKAVESNGSLVFDPVGPTSLQAYNAIAYDTVDNYIYGISAVSGAVLQIDSGGGVTATTAHASNTDNVGGWDPADDEIYFTAPGHLSMTVYNPATNATSTLALSKAANVIDLSYADGYFWGVLQAAAPEIERIDPSTGVVTDIPVPASMFAASSPTYQFGAAWTYGNGNLGFSDNNTGEIYQVSVATPSSASPTFTLVSAQPGPPNSQNDGTANPGEATDLSIAKTASSSVADGGTVTYSLSVTNHGPGDSSGYVVTDQLAAGLTNTSTSTPGCSIAAGLLSCLGNPLNAGAAAAPIIVTANVPDPFTASITNTASVIANEADPDASNNVGSATIGPAADVSLTKDASPSSVVSGGSVTYSLVAKNAGPDTATGVVVSDPLPAGLRFVSASSGCSYASGVVTCTDGALAPGAGATYTVTAAASGTLGAAIDNTASIHSSTPDPDPGNDTASSTVTLVGADLSLSKSASPQPAVPGTDETFTLTAHNTGPSAATTIVVSDPLPAGTTFVSAPAGCRDPSGTVTCTDASLASGASASYAIVARLDSSLTTGVVNTATVSSATPDPDPGNNVATASAPLGPRADLLITKLASASVLTAGDQVTYTLVATNRGPSGATGVTVTDPLPVGITASSARPGQGTCSTKVGVVCNLGTIAAGGSAQILLTTNVASTAAGAIINRASVTSQDPDMDPGDNTTSSTITVNPPPAPPQPVSSLQIQKRANHSNAYPGQLLTYTLTVSNHGPNAAADANVTDAASLAMSAINAKPSQGTCKVGTPMTCQLGTIANGQTATIKVTAKVAHAGSEHNTASVTSASKDLNPADNLADARTTLKPLLRLRKTASVKTTSAGAPITYHLKVTNPTTVAVNSVKVCDQLPHRVQYTRSEPTARKHARTYCWTIQRLKARTTQTLRITTKVTSNVSGKIINHATATAHGAKTARASTTIHVNALKLKLTKTASPRDPTTGQNVTYTLTVTNRSTTAMTKLRVCDPLPHGLLYLRSNPSAHLTTSGYCWTIKHLNKHASRGLRITINVAPGTHGRITNHATATAPGARTTHASTTIHVRKLPRIGCPSAINGADRHSSRRTPTAHEAC